jgi:hypothetical protein
MWILTGLTILAAVHVIVQLISFFIFNTELFGSDILGAVGGFVILLLFTMSFREDS